jgi:hypothetical protein
MGGYGDTLATSPVSFTSNASGGTWRRRWSCLGGVPAGCDSRQEPGALGASVYARGSWPYGRAPKELRLQILTCKAIRLSRRSKAVQGWGPPFWGAQDLGGLSKEKKGTSGTSWSPLPPYPAPPAQPWSSTRRAVPTLCSASTCSTRTSAHVGKGYGGECMLCLAWAPAASWLGKHGGGGSILLGATPPWRCWPEPWDWS